MNNLAQIKAVLRCPRHFAELPEEVYQAIAAAAVQRRFNAAQAIYVEGEPALQ
jgi:hypothetical protein